MKTLLFKLFLYIGMYSFTYLSMRFRLAGYLYIYETKECQKHYISVPKLFANAVIGEGIVGVIVPFSKIEKIHICSPFKRWNFIYYDNIRKCYKRVFNRFTWAQYQIMKRLPKGLTEQQYTDKLLAIAVGEAIKNLK